MSTDIIPKRFWVKVNKRGKFPSNARGRCWDWIGGRNSFGYGVYFFMGKCVKAHRHIYESIHGKMGAGIEVCHKCDNPSCVRPSHLFSGTHKENFMDASRKGRLKSFLGSRTHCKNGHPYIPENTRYYLHKKSGNAGRVCIFCKTDKYGKVWETWILERIKYLKAGRKRPFRTKNPPSRGRIEG